MFQQKRRHDLASYIVVLLLTCADSKAFVQTAPIPAPGFPMLIDSIGPTGPQEGAVLADLDRDGCLDIIVASSRSVYAFKKDGSLLPGWPQKTNLNTINSPAVGDLDRDGNFEVVTLDRNGLLRKSFLYVWNFKGSLLPGFPLELGLGETAITLYDLDGDLDLEIIGGFGGKYYVFNHAGTIASGWPQEIAPFYPSTKASAGDLNNDGMAEIVVATQFISTSDELLSQGRLYAWHGNGELLPDWPVNTPLGYLYLFRCDPALVDMDKDGFLEIAVGAASINRTLARGFAALYRHDGVMMSGWPVFTAGSEALAEIGAGPAAANLNGDSNPELIFGDLFDHIVAWNGDGSLVPGWPINLGELDTALVARSTFIHPSVGDIDDDGQLEILLNNNQADLVDGVWRGRIYAFNHDASSLPWSPLRPRQFAAINTVAMGDLENDGSVELVTLSGDTQDRQVWLTVWNVPGVPYVEERFPWPMYGHDRWHTSQYGFKPPDEPKVAVEEKGDANAQLKDFVLRQNYPNPFSASSNPSLAQQGGTVLRYELPEPAEVRISFFDLLGKKVKELFASKKAAGRHEVYWEGRDQHGRALPAGLYVYRLEAAPLSNPANLIVRTQKLVLMN